MFEPVEMSGDHWIGSDFSAATQDGSVRLVLPKDYSASLSLETRDGEIAFDYPDPVVENEPVPLKVVTKKNARLLAAPIGKGGAPVKLVTFLGNIEFSSKK